MRKVYYLLLCFVLLFTAVFTGTAVADDGEIKVAQVTAAAGDSVPVGISITKNPIIGGISFSVNYDPDVLSISITCQLDELENEVCSNVESTLSDSWSVNVVSPGTIRCVYIGSKNWNTQGEILKLNFTVKDDAPTGETTISLSELLAGKLNQSEDQVNFNITNGSVTVQGIEATVNGYTGTYDGNSHSISVAVTEPALGSSISYSSDGVTYSDTNPEYIDAGTYKVYYKVTAEGYKDLTGSADVVINKAESSVATVPSAVIGLEYNGSNLTLLTGGTTTTGKMVYSLSADGEFSETLPVGKDADDYTVYYKVQGDKNHNDTEAQTINVTVAQKEVGLTWGKTDFTFDGTEKAPTATATETVTGDTVNVTVTGGQTNAGTSYTATAASLDNNNYKLLAVKTTTFSIAKAAAPTLTDVNKNVAYTATSVNQSLSAVGMPDNAGTKTYTPGTPSISGSVSVSGFAVDANGNVTAALSNISEANVGDTITLPVTISSTNYEDAALNVIVTIVDKENAYPVINPEGSLTKTYGDAAFTVTVSAQYPGTGTGIWTWSSTNPEVATVTSGSTEATVTILSAGTTTIKAEYSSDTTEGEDSLELTVNQKEITVSGITASNKEYDTTTDAVLNMSNAVLTGKVGTDDLTVTANGAFADKNAGTGKTVTISGLTLTGTAASNYKLAASGQQTTTTADITAKSTTVSGVTASNRNYEEGTTTVELSGGTVDNKLGTDTVSVDLSQAAGTMTDDKAGTGKAVTVNGVKLSGTDAGNYTLTAQPTGVTVTINKINWTNITAVGEAKYGTSNATVDLSAKIAEGGTIGTISVQDASSVLNGTPTVSSGTLSYSLKNDANLVGSSAVVTVPVNGATNYNDYTVTVTLSVKDKDGQTIEASDITLTYGETKSIGASVTVGDGTLSYQVSSGNVNADVDPTTGAVTGTHVGTAEVTISASDTSNYRLTTKIVTVTVEKADITESDITKPEAIVGLGYTGQDQILIDAGNSESVGTMQYALGQDAQTAPANWSASLPTGNAAGTYYVWFKIIGDANHNDYVGSAVEVNIANKPMTVTAADVNVPYDGVAHGITVTVTDPADGYTIKYGTEAGVYNQDQSPTVTEVGDSPLTVYYEVTAANYDTYTGSAVVTIKGVRASAENVVAAVDGQPHGITVVVTEPTEGYTIKYGTAEGVYNLTASPTITELTESPLTVYFEVTADDPSYGPFRGSATVELKETMTVKVDGTIITNTGNKGVPADMPTTDLKLTIVIRNKATGEEVSRASDIPVTVADGQTKIEMDGEFYPKIDGLSPADHTVEVIITPNEVVGAAPMSQRYALSASAWVGPAGEIMLYMTFDDGKRGEVQIIRVYSLPEDEIGAYSIREDGTKEYLLFHTYDICMQWLGSDEMCRGYERCFHKENPYVNPFVKGGELIEEIRINP